MNKKLIAFVSSAVLLALPVIALGVALPTSTPAQYLTLQSFFDVLFKVLWILFVAFAVIMFIIAGFLFLTANGDEAKIGVARNAVLWGVVGVVMGIVAFSLPFVLINAFAP